MYMYIYKSRLQKCAVFLLNLYCVNVILMFLPESGTWLFWWRFYNYLVCQLSLDMSVISQSVLINH